MQVLEHGRVERLHFAAAHVTRHLPEAHILTRRYRALRFHGALKTFLRLLYAVDVASLSDKDLSETENLTRVAINAVEIRMLLGALDDGEKQLCSELLRRLRDALDALDAGLPADPQRRPSKDELLDSLADDLQQLQSA